MKRTLVFMACVLASLTMSAQDDLTVEDIQNSGCLSMARGEESEPIPTIVLTKEGNILLVQLLNYESNCGTTGFEVTPTVNDGKDGDPLSVSISVVPRLPGGELPACECPYNVSFTVRDWEAEAKSFYLSCWWYKGMVELTEGKPLVLEYKVGGSSENASVQHPVDMTSRIVNPRFDNNDVTTGWSGTRFGNWNAKENAEIYNDKYDAFQKIEGLPAGVYAVGVKAFYMAGEELQTAFNNYKANDEASHYVKLYTEANGRQTEVDICSVFDNQVKDSLGCTGEKSLYDEETGRTYHFPKDLAAAERYMHELNCYDNKVLAMTDGSLTIGVRTNSVVYGDWSVFDDFTLTYYGQGADAYQMYLDDIREKNLNKTIVAEGTLYTKYYIDEYCKHRYATTKEGVNMALADIQGAYSLLQRNIELWKEWKLAMNRGRALAASPYYAGSEQAQLLAQHCGVEATETEAARNLTNEQLETEISKTEAMINTLYNQEGFANKMLKEGKQWVYSRHRDSELYDENGIPYDMVEVVTKVTFTINGDTLINGRHYAKLYKQEEGQPTVFYMALREEGTTVYSCVGNEDKRLIEFNPYHFRDVQSLSYFEHYSNIIDVVDIIYVNDRAFVRHHYKDESGSVLLPVGVEGIGYEFNGILGMSYEYTPCDYISFEACYEDGECIFTADDFNAQTKPVIDMAYRPFVEEGKVWKVGDVLSGNPVQLVEYYYFDGDTIIGGKTCIKMMCQRYVNPDHAESHFIIQSHSISYVGAWYEEGKKVYVYDSINNQFNLMYDFSVNTNDTVQIRDCLYVVGPKQIGGIKGFKGVYENIRRCEDGTTSYSPTWMESVGSIDGPTKNVYYVDEAPMWFLMSCTVGDEVIYFNDEYEDGATPEAARKQRIDFTHTIKTRPKSRMMREEAEASLYGEYNDQQLGINLDPLDDSYLVQITDESGKAVYEKAVNAGNIVGLNIDISDYAEGRYTVTVENSNESFTAQFDTQRTSFVEVRSKRLEVKDAIYNLQGQRISSLRKGLNIVSGWKVFVK